MKNMYRCFLSLVLCMCMVFVQHGHACVCGEQRHRYRAG